MIAILLTFGYFVLGMIVGAVLVFVLWTHYRARIIAEVFKGMLVEQGYTIKDGRIVPTDGGRKASDLKSDIEEQLREVFNEL